MKLGLRKECEDIPLVNCDKGSRFARFKDMIITVLEAFERMLKRCDMTYHWWAGR